MNVVTYARVSTESQFARGQSLQDQEARFATWLERYRHRRLRAYSESKSAGTVEQRQTFLSMLDDIENTPPAERPYAVVIDSIDRFARNKLEGVETLMRLASLGVKLWELERDRTKALDLSVDADRDYVWREFDGAESEHRRHKKRQIKRYSGQRDRGATTTNRPAFGLKAVGPTGNKQLEPDPETAHIVEEVDRRILAGEPLRSVLRWVHDFSGTWRSARGLKLALLGKKGAYVAAGVRTAEDQVRLREVLGLRAGRGGGTWVHELKGLIACGQCVAAGIEPAKARMIGKPMKSNLNPYNLACEGKAGKIHSHHSIATHKIIGPLLDQLLKLRDPRVAAAVEKAWHKSARPAKVSKLKASLEKQLESIDHDEAALDAQVRTALSLPPSVSGEVERALERVGSERIALLARRRSVEHKLADLPADRISRPLDANELRVMAEDTVPVRECVQQWVDKLGWPVYERNAKGRVVVRWPFLDLIRPEAAPDYEVDDLDPHDDDYNAVRFPSLRFVKLP